MNKICIYIILIFLSVSIYSTDRTDDATSDFNEENLEIYEGNELTIFSTQEKTQQIKTIEKDEIDKINPGDIPSLLEKKFNLSLTQTGPYGNKSGVKIRGFGGGRILILIDGVPLNSSQSGDFDLSNINVNDVEKIEIIYGGSDTKYNFSGAVGGVINIITKKKDKSGFKIGGKISTLFYYPDIYNIGYKGLKKFLEWFDFFDTQNCNFYFGIGNEHVYWNLNLSGNKAFNHFIFKDNDNIKRRRINNEIFDFFTSTSLLANLPYYSKLLFSGDFYYGNKNIPGKINNINPGKEIKYIAKGSVLYDSDYVGTENIDTELIVNYDFNSIEWHEKGVYNLHNLNTVSVIHRWGFIIKDWITLRIGGDFKYSYLDSNNMGKINKFDGGGYVTAEFSIKNIAQIIPSVKLIYFKYYPIAIPKLGFIFYIGKYFTLKNNYFRTFRLPTLEDMYWPKEADAEGNPDVKPEDGVGGDIILSFYKEKILSFESSFYVTYYRDAILWQEGSDGIWRPGNIGNSFYFGSDNSIKSEFSEYVKLTLSYSFLMTYVIEGNYTFTSDKRMPYVPIHTFGFGIEVNWKSGSINLLGHFESERYINVTNIEELNPYFTLDLNFNQKINIFTIFFSFKNILNMYYFLVENYPMTGGSFTLGLKIDFEKEFK